MRGRGEDSQEVTRRGRDVGWVTKGLVVLVSRSDSVMLSGDDMPGNQVDIGVRNYPHSHV